MVVQYVSMVKQNQDAQIVIVQMCVNHEKNHTILDVGREAIENIVVFAHIVLLMFFPDNPKKESIRNKSKELKIVIYIY